MLFVCVCVCGRGVFSLCARTLLSFSIDVLAVRKNIRHISGVTRILNVHYDMHCPWMSVSLTVLSDPGSEYVEDFLPQDEFL